MVKTPEPTEITKVYDAVIASFIRALSFKDHDTAVHSERVAQMAVFLASELGVPEDELTHVRRCALLHDIGKLAIPDAILHKVEPLSEEEYVVIREHIRYAIDILEPVEFLKPAAEILYKHHERWDGRGYPDGLKGEVIPLAARIISVVGVWDALRTDRPYRPAFTEAEAIQFMREERGKMFDPQVVDAFLKIIESSNQR
ncbi:MAG: HD-GYP domain-containing protein [Chloroflexi bacterium]|nr:MAG: HD-GYP domain-containing protein [Chloroflexota bacterium]